MYRFTQRAPGLALPGVLLFLLATVVSAQPEAGLPEAVEEAVRKAFPDAEIRSFGQERESGVQYYEVNLILDGHRIEVEVDKYGGIGEVERRVGLDALPDELADSIREARGPHGRIRIERHERWGVGRNGRFVPLETPRLFYEIKVYVGGKHPSMTWRPQPAPLPEQVKAAIRKRFPNAVVIDVVKETEEEGEIYEIGLVHNSRDIEVEAAPDGTLLEIETPAATGDLPQAVLDAVRQAVGEGEIRRAARIDVLAEAVEDGIKPLEKPVVVYEMQVIRDDRLAEIEVSEDGRVLEPPEWEEYKPINDEDFFEDEDDEDDDDDDDEYDDDDD